MMDEAAGDAPVGIEELCRHAARLVEDAHGPLKSVRLQAGDLVVELEWPAPEGQVLYGGPVPDPPRAEPGAPAEPAPAPPPDDGTFVVSAPLVGTFYRAPSPGTPAFVDVGDQVVAGQQVAIVEAMKLMNAVEVDRPGRVVEVLVTDGSAVEYSEALFVLAPV
jgi:acetyl-CoA carboxylase biotin carboxyl carrier protein